MAEFPLGLATQDESNSLEPEVAPLIPTLEWQGQPTEFKATVSQPWFPFWNLGGNSLKQETQR